MTDRLDDAIRASAVICFPKNEASFSKQRKWGDTWPIYSAIIEDDGKVVANVAVVERTMIVADQPYKIAGVQNVFVLPEYRRRGLSDMTLRAVMDEAGRIGFDFGLLFASDKVEAVYSRNGWQPISSRRFRCIVDGPIYQVPDETIVMYYPLAKKIFPEGTAVIQGSKW